MLFTPDLHEVGMKFPGGAIQSGGNNELTRLNIALYGSSPYKPSRKLRAVPCKDSRDEVNGGCIWRLRRRIPVLHWLYRAVKRGKMQNTVNRQIWSRPRNSKTVTDISAYFKENFQDHIQYPIMAELDTVICLGQHTRYDLQGRAIIRGLRKPLKFCYPWVLRMAYVPGNSGKLPHSQTSKTTLK